MKYKLLKKNFDGNIIKEYEMDKFVNLKVGEYKFDVKKILESYQLFLLKHPHASEWEDIFKGKYKVEISEPRLLNFLCLLESNLGYHSDLLLFLEIIPETIREIEEYLNYYNIGNNLYAIMDNESLKILNYNELFTKKYRVFSENGISYKDDIHKEIIWWIENVFREKNDIIYITIPAWMKNYTNNIDRKILCKNFKCSKICFK